VKAYAVLSAMSLVLLLVLLAACSNSTGVGDGNPTDSTGTYVVLAWNDLGMHCLNPTYDQAVVLPPFNTVWAQVIKTGNPPEVVTAGITVNYSIENNTYSYGKRSFGQFWENAVALFGPLLGITDLPHNQGLAGAGLSGAMTAAGDHFIVVGIPVTPVDDADHWDPFQVAHIVVKDGQGKTLAQTRATVPTSEEMNCARCHGASAFADILGKHDSANGTNLVASQPVLCATCHGSPALGTSGPGTSGKYLSQAMHTFHSTSGAVCYDCHPGAVTKCQRSLAHTTDDGNCITCHGGLATVGGSIPSQRIPWVDEPACATCHAAVAGVATGNTLYRDAAGHGGVYCEGCHGSPHAMIPSREAPDNYQALQYQGFTGKVKSIGSCGVCHESSRGGDDEGTMALLAVGTGVAADAEGQRAGRQISSEDDFAEVHGGVDPEVQMSCHVCHTTVPTDRAKWPHAYQWKNSN